MMSGNKIQRSQLLQFVWLSLFMLCIGFNGTFAQDHQELLVDLNLNGQIVSGTHDKNASSQKLMKIIELDEGRKALREVLQDIADQAGLKLSYSEQLIPLNKKVNVKDSKVTVKQALWNVLQGTSLRFGVSATGQLFFFKMQSRATDQRQETVIGMVTDAGSGETLPGVNIAVKGTTTGTSTNAQGQYELVVPSLSDTLIFSFIGYQTVEVPIDGRTEIDVALQTQAISGEELVVVGYGTQSEQDLTGAIERISAENLNQGAVQGPLESLAGRAAGVNILQVGDEPGDSPTIRVRGIGSLSGGNDPLVVVDGVQGGTDLLEQVPPSEIQSIEILKGPSATAIYGSRGAQGVVLVTTKLNEDGTFTVSYDGSLSFDFLSNKVDILNAEEWRATAEQFSGVGQSADNGGNTDWYDLLTRTGMTQNHTVSFGGGSDNFNYRASVSGILQKGVVLTSSNDNYIIRVQATQDALDGRLTVKANVNSSIENDVGVGNVGRASFSGNLISNAYVSKPVDPVFAQDGSYFYDSNVFEYINPYAVAEEIVNEGETTRQLGSLSAELEVIPSLTVSWFGSWRQRESTSGYYASPTTTIADAREMSGIASVSTNISDAKQMDISVNYENAIGSHRFSALGVYEWQRQVYNGNNLSADGFINDLTEYHALELGTVEPGDYGSYKNDRKLISFLGRINYAFDNKYLFTASLRRDGSSVFGEDHKWGIFPSASLGWRITEEPFMSDIDLFSSLKLRVGYGVTGNQQGLGPLQSKELVSSAGRLYFGGELINSFEVSQNSNSNLAWEERTQMNLGLDFGLFDDRLTGTIDVYRAKTENLLFGYSVPQPPFPHGNITANVGELENEGAELSLDYLALNSGDFQLNLTGNVSLVRNEVVSLSGSVNGVELITNYVGRGNNTYLIEGRPIGQFNITYHTGINENGEETVADLNNDGIINQGSRSEDRYYAGQSTPTYTFAFTPSLNYKNFDFSMVWLGQGGNKIYNGIRQNFSQLEKLGRSNVFESATELGMFTTQYGSDLWLEDGDFVRLNNVTIGYSFDPDLISGVRNMRLSVTGQNLHVFTGYSGLDPQVGWGGGDNGIYPRTTSITVGLEVTF